MSVIRNSTFCTAALLVAGLLATPMLPAQSPEPAAPVFKRADFDPGAAPRAFEPPVEADGPFQFESKMFDFGRIREGEQVKVTFAFRNISDKPVEIESIRAACGCTTPSVFQKVYQPGEQGTIEATYNSAGRRGRDSKTVNVKTAAPEEHNYVLTLGGMIVSDVYLSSGMVNFGDVEEGVGRRQTVELIDTTAEGVEIVSATSSVRGLTVSVQRPQPYQDPTSGKNGQRTILELVVPRDMPRQNLRGSLTIRTNYEPIPTFSATITGRVVGDIVVEPAQAYFGMMRPGTSAKRVARLKVTNGEQYFLDSFEVLRGEGSQDVAELPKLDVEVTTPDRDTGLQNVALMLQAHEIPGAFDGVVLMKGHTDVGRKLDVEIPFRLLVQAPGQQPRPAVPVQPGVSTGAVQRISLDELRERGAIVPRPVEQ